MDYNRSEELFTLKKMRDISRLSISEIETKVNISYRTIRNWEKGKSTPGLIKVNELVKLYGFTLDQIDLTIFSSTEGE